MKEELKRTYKSYKELPKRNQIEYTEPTELFGKKGEVLVRGGWARKDVFLYDKEKARPKSRCKEWDFYQISNGTLVAQINFANISVAGYISVSLVDINTGIKVVDHMDIFIGGRKKYALPKCATEPNVIEHKIGKTEFKFETTKKERHLTGKGLHKKTPLEFDIKMYMMDLHESLTTVLPWNKKKNKYFMTCKMNSMPAEGYIKFGEEEWKFDLSNSFGTLDWGRVNTPYRLVWYWGNGSWHIKDDKGKDHILGFEITWAIGDEDNATETAIFYDGKLHKFGSIDVENFPKGRYMEPWHFVSEDGRFDMTMTPKFDYAGDMNLVLLRMKSHQVHGLWNGFVILDDGTKIEVKDQYAFCEYVENRW